MRDGADAQRAAFDATVRKIRAMPPETAYEAARELVTEHEDYRGHAADLRAEQALRIWESGSTEAGSMTLAQLGERIGVTRQRADQLLKRARELAATQSTIPEPEAVVAAIVTSRKGILVTERRDGRPPWGFVTGKIEPRESPADAAVREVKEETGLEVLHGQIIGRRIHPVTERTMIYMSAKLARGASTDAFVGDRAELKAVRWVSFEEAAELLPDMFEPVKAYLARTVRHRNGSRK